MNREEQKQVLIDTANHIINRDNTSPYSENLRELARIALASLEAEPVGAFHIAEQQVDGTSDYLKDGEWPIDNGIIEVYAAPLAPVSVPAAMEMDDDFDSAFEHGKAVGWNAYRAAMLHSAEPVSQAYKLNALDGNSPVTPDGWIPVSERMPEPYEYVLVTDGFDGCEVMRVNTDGYWGPAKSLYPGGITHWMPLPEPPQEAK